MPTRVLLLLMEEWVVQLLVTVLTLPLVVLVVVAAMAEIVLITGAQVADFPVVVAPQILPLAAEGLIIMALISQILLELI